MRPGSFGSGHRATYGQSQGLRKCPNKRRRLLRNAPARAACNSGPNRKAESNHAVRGASLGAMKPVIANATPPYATLRVQWDDHKPRFCCTVSSTAA
eukprot:7235442-Alexandrium_andersonii.AAC.1